MLPNYGNSFAMCMYIISSHCILEIYCKVICQSYLNKGGGKGRYFCFRISGIHFPFPLSYFSSLECLYFTEYYPLEKSSSAMPFTPEQEVASVALYRTIRCFLSDISNKIRKPKRLTVVGQFHFIAHAQASFCYKIVAIFSTSDPPELLWFTPSPCLILQALVDILKSR